MNLHTSTNTLLVASLTGFIMTGCNDTPAPVLVFEQRGDRIQDRPNILWLVSEDNSPETIGVYGDPATRTPNIDRLAEEGLVFRHAFANSPVCTVARSTLVAGMHAPSLGLHLMRSRTVLPDYIEDIFYPRVLQQAGYYTTNNAEIDPFTNESKTDYNVPEPHSRFWDESSPEAHYKNREPDQPFFAVFNNHDPHESRMFLDVIAEEPVTNPADIQIPPYHPDIPEIRRSWAHYYDLNSRMDEWVGEMLKELEEEGLADNTIVMYYSDHGGVLPRSKRFLYHTGTAIPLVVYFPENWKHLAPAEPGSTLDRLVSFVDFPSTIMSITGIEIPDNYQGRAFMGATTEPPEETVFFYKDRMAQRFGSQRGVFDGEYRYIRDYLPHRPNGQYSHYPFRMQSFRAWYQAWADGETTPVQSQFWLPQPAEQLFLTADDPWEVKNLAQDPAYSNKLSELRESTRRHILNNRDAGFIPEDMFDDLSGNQTVYEYIWSEEYPLERTLEIAEFASTRNPEFIPELKKAMRDPYPPIRFWGAMGCAVLGYDAISVRLELESLLDDEYGSIRATAAEALARMGDMDQAIASLGSMLTSTDATVLLYAVNALAALDVDEKYHEFLLTELRPIAEDANREIHDDFNFHRQLPRRVATYLVRKWTEDDYPPLIPGPFPS